MLDLNLVSNLENQKVKTHPETHPKCSTNHKLHTVQLQLLITFHFRLVSKYNLFKWVRNYKTFTRAYKIKEATNLFWVLENRTQNYFGDLSVSYFLITSIFLTNSIIFDRRQILRVLQPWLNSATKVRTSMAHEKHS